ncbi:TPA: threonine synthase [Candidatus Peregrinibacteria bacterium]|nr:threonine synthase [Candidatus Peregrinibacteria bacterium]
MNNNNSYKIECVQCKSVFTEEETITRCLKCGQALDIIFDIEKLKKTINIYNLKNTPISAMKYLDFYPLKDRQNIISLDEGATPLVKSKELSKKYGIKNLYIKNEGANPTGVFKDRGSLVEISKAVELGAAGIVVASTGNMAASVSAYSARAGIPCYVLVPDTTPLGKLSQSLAYGGNVIKVRGTYADCVRLSSEMSEKYGYLLAGDYAFRGEGQKSIAYEIIEQLNWNVPDVVLAPVGCGTNLYGIAKGFFEWFQLGLIDKVPRIIGTQPEKADTLCSAFHANEKEHRTIQFPSSLCGAVNIGAPLDDIKLLNIIRDSKGSFEIIDDTSVLESQKDMAMLASVFTEPSGAIPIACLEKLKSKNIISEDDVVVCIATGVGLKDSHSATILFPDFPAVENTIEDITEFLDSGILDLKSDKNNSEILFSTKPSNPDIKKIAEDKFSFDSSKNLKFFKELCEETDLFFERRSEMKKSEFQAILEEVIANSKSSDSEILKIVDVIGTHYFSKKAKAKVIIQFKGEEISAEATGTGSVDAAISAIEKALKQKTEYKINLDNFEVNVQSGGLDASVRVKIKFSDKNNNSVTVIGVSPDLVVASLMAYQKGFVRLFMKKQ